MKRLAGIGLVVVLIGSPIIQGCSISYDANTTCSKQAEAANDEETVRRTLQKDAATGPTIAPELVDGVVEMLVNDPEAQKTEYTLCMGDRGALCFIDGGELFADEQIADLLKERGWSSPTKWDCYWPETNKVATNPFK